MISFVCFRRRLEQALDWEALVLSWRMWTVMFSTNLFKLERNCKVWKTYLSRIIERPVLFHLWTSRVRLNLGTSASKYCSTCHFSKYKVLWYLALTMILLMLTTWKRRFNSYTMKHLRTHAIDCHSAELAEIAQPSQTVELFSLQ